MGKVRISISGGGFSRLITILVFMWIVGGFVFNLAKVLIAKGASFGVFEVFVSAFTLLFFALIFWFLNGSWEIKVDDQKVYAYRLFARRVFLKTNIIDLRIEQRGMHINKRSVYSCYIDYMDTHMKKKTILFYVHNNGSTVAVKKEEIRRRILSYR